MMKISTFLIHSFLLNVALSCKKAENTFEKRIPHFRLDTENFGQRDFYECSELHKDGFSSGLLFGSNRIELKILNLLLINIMS